MDKLELKHIAPYLAYGLKFQYNSYDHTKAVIEHNDACDYGQRNPNCFYISDELKAKYLVKKIGRIHSMQMRKHGCIFKIGAKYPKTYYESEIGINVKPILRPLSDLTKEIEDNKGRKFIPAKLLWSVSENDEDNFDTYGLFPPYWTLNIRMLKNGYRNIDYGDIEKLLQWHFDIFGLIDAGLAIDINTLK